MAGWDWGVDVGWGGDPISSFYQKLIQPYKTGSLQEKSQISKVGIVPTYSEGGLVGWSSRLVQISNFDHRNFQAPLYAVLPKEE